MTERWFFSKKCRVPLLVSPKIICFCPGTLFTFVLLLNGQCFGKDSASWFPPVYHSSDDECTRQKPQRSCCYQSSYPSHLPSQDPSQRAISSVKCLSSSWAQLQYWVIPPPTCLSLPSFLSLRFPLLELFKPPLLFFHSAAFLLPPSWECRICVCVVFLCVRGVTEAI